MGRRKGATTCSILSGRGYFLTVGLVETGWPAIGSNDFSNLELEQIEQVNSMTTATEHLYVVTDNFILGGEPIIKGTRTPVRAIVEIYRSGVSAEEIPLRLPHLSLAQVFDALSYYNDHPDQINAHIERNRIPENIIDPLTKSV